MEPACVLSCTSKVELFFLCSLKGLGIQLGLMTTTVVSKRTVYAIVIFTGVDKGRLGNAEAPDE